MVLAFMSDDRAAPHLASGALVRVLEDCCRPFPASSSSLTARRRLYWKRPSVVATH